MEDADFALALHLQEQFDEENKVNEECIVISQSEPSHSPNQYNAKPRPISSKSPKSPKRKRLLDVQREERHSNQLLSVVDASWELVDPNPDLHGLFLEFNSAFFWGQLEGVEVRWSPRMTSCAGICCYEGRGGLCSVRLSVPLLKLRPRKDLVETLLHEMIHAYLFVTQNNKDHDGHGPEFHKHMHRINERTGANITVYHSFVDEVKLYKQHWWRCNGPCKDRKPYFGYVKRAMNRAPAPSDLWWADHKKTCGGQFIKIKEPENYKSKKDKGASNVSVPEKKKKTEGNDIREFFKKLPPEPPIWSASSNVHTFSSPVTSSSSSKTKTSPVKKPSTVTVFGGTGHVLGRKS